MVLPEPRDHEHVRVADSFLQGLEITDGKAGDSGIEGREPLVQPVSDMGKADRKFIVGRKHGPGPSHTKGLVISFSAACRTLPTRHRSFAGSSISTWTPSTRPWSSATIRYCGESQLQ